MKRDREGPGHEDTECLRRESPEEFRQGILNYVSERLESKFVTRGL